MNELCHCILRGNLVSISCAYRGGEVPIPAVPGTPAANAKPIPQRYKGRG